MQVEPPPPYTLRYNYRPAAPMRASQVLGVPTYDTFEAADTSVARLRRVRQIQEPDACEEAMACCAVGTGVAIQTVLCGLGISWLAHALCIQDG